MTSPKIRSYSEFWSFYLSEHKNRTNKILHVLGCFVGLIVAWLSFSSLGLLGVPGVIVALVSGYACAWTGHLVFEKNRPATWRYPVWSLVSELRMVSLIVLGRIKI